MFDLEGKLLDIHEHYLSNHITESERDVLIESVYDKYIDNYFAECDAYYLEGFFGKLAKKNAEKKVSQEEVDKTVAEIKAKDGKLSKADKSKLIKLITCGAITLAYALAVVGYENRSALITALDNKKVYVDNPKFADEIIESVCDLIDEENYTEAKLALFEYGMDQMLSESAFDLIYTLILEAEEDHADHMKRKEIASQNSGKYLDDLPNKKYKTKKNGEYADPEKTKKAELKYKAAGVKDSVVNGEYRVSGDDPSYNAYITMKTPKASDIKCLEYMKKKLASGSDKDLKNYKRAFRIFCTKHGIDKGSSMYVQYDPETLRITEWKSGKKIDSKKTIGKEKLHALPKGYILIHKSDQKGLTELKPRAGSNKYIPAGDYKVNGQYHDTGRCYFVLQKEHSFIEKLKGKRDDLTAGIWGRGNYVYKLVSPISGFFVDGENNETRGLDEKYFDIDKLVGKAVFVKTDRPLKVRLVNMVY